MAMTTMFSTMGFSCLATACPVMIGIIKDELLQRLPENEKLKKAVEISLKVTAIVLAILIILSEIIYMPNVTAFSFHFITGIILGISMGIIVIKLLNSLIFWSNKSEDVQKNGFFKGFFRNL